MKNKIINKIYKLRILYTIIYLVFMLYVSLIVRINYIKFLFL